MARKITLIEYDENVYDGDGMEPAIQFRDAVPSVTGQKRQEVTDKELETIDIAEIAQRIEDMRVYARVISSSSSASSSSSSETSSLVSQWRYENGFLYNDSEDGNHWQYEEGTVGVDTGDYKEGSACIKLEPTYSEGVGQAATIEISDASLSYDFPGKAGNTDVDFTICFWFKVEHQLLSANGETDFYFAKWDGAQTMSFVVGAYFEDTVDEGPFYFLINSGANQYTFPTDVQTGRWYHAAVSYTPSAYRIRIWDDTAQGLLDDDLTGDPVTMNPTSVRLFLQGWTQSSDGADAQIRFDDMRIYKTALSADEIDAIRQGTM